MTRRETPATSWRCHMPVASPIAVSAFILFGLSLARSSGVPPSTRDPIVDDLVILHDSIGHPRVAGTFARVLGRYVREAKALI